MKKLRIQWKKFADEYIKTGNVYQSAINSGYSENYAKTNACKLLEKDSIKAYIDDRMKKLEEEAIADQKEILKGLTRQARREEKEYQVVVIQKPSYDDNGNFLGMEQTPQMVEIPTQNKDSIKAWELLGKRYQLWTDKVDMTLDVPTIISGAEADITKRTGLTPWQVKLAKEKGVHYGIDELVRAIRIIRETEKGVKTGAIEQNMSVEFILASVL